MILPFPPRRSHLRAFWTALNAAGAVVCCVSLLVLHVPHALLGALVFFGALLSAGLVWQDGPVWLYRAWNRVARAAAPAAEWWVLAVSHYVVFAVMRLGGSQLAVGGAIRSRRTMWEPLTAESIASRRGGPSGENWLIRLLEDARTRGHEWRLGIVPFVALLSLFPRQTESDPIPTNTYTLF